MLMNMKSLLAVLISLLFALAVAGCWDPDNPIRAGRNGAGVPARPSHNANLGGHLHAQGYCEPYLHCVACHGDSLQGGPVGQPSCTSCHADHWNETTCGMIAHTVDLGGYLHAPGYCQPLQNCAQCHGSNLRGGTSGEPSCYECHDAKWAEGECGD
jgi:hypothetical protein